MFYNIYKRVKFLKEVYIRIFFIILKNLIKVYYFNNILFRLLYLNIYNNI
jgi:hypothetical protein